MKKIVISALVIASLIVPAYAEHRRIGNHFGPRFAPRAGNHIGRNVGIGVGILGLGLLGAAILGQPRPVAESCLIGYDRYGRPVYDPECFE